MVFFYFDIDNFPLIILTIEASPCSMDEMELFLKKWEELYDKSRETNERYKLIFDVRKATVSLKDTQYLQRLGGWLTEHKIETETHMDRTAILVSNDTIRLLLNVVFVLYRPVRPYKIFNDINLVKKWVVSDEQGD